MLEDPVLAIGDGDVPHGVLPACGRGQRAGAGEGRGEGTVSIPAAPCDVGNPATWCPGPWLCGPASRRVCLFGSPVRTMRGAAVVDGVGGRARSSRGQDTMPP